MDTVILPDRGAVASWVADLIATTIDANPGVAIGLAGGSTPSVVHEALVGRSIDWSRAVTWMTDERWVPPDHPESNQRMVRHTLINRVNGRFIAPDTTLHSPSEAANRFSDVLVAEGIGTERMSLVTLGMGHDGHTASLFPGSSALDATEPYTATWVDHLDTWRLTTTFGFLAQAHRILFMVTGEAKAEMIRAVARGADVPATHVTAREAVTWVLDEAAASEL
jgi:6-phosphogluconolactonase